jgi:hypothetical protein
MYFWQDAPHRAFVWAKNVMRIDKEQIRIVEAEINLEHCCDFFDLKEYTIIRKLLDIFERESTIEGDGFPIQEGLTIVAGRVVRNRSNPVSNYKDCALIDWYVDYMEGRHNRRINCVRGIFIDGTAICPESFLFDWAHVQIAVRRAEAIVRWRLAIGES